MRARRVIFAANLLVWLCAGLFGYAYLVGRNRLVVLDETMPVEAVREAGVRIVHLADLHVGAVGWAEQRLIRKVNALEPDLVLITGDVAGFWGSAEPAREVLESFRPRVGTFVTLGDADYSHPLQHCAFCHEPDNRTLLPDQPYRILRHETVRVDVRGIRLALTGVDDLTGPFHEEEIPFATGEAVRIGLVSSLPDAERFRGSGYDLVLTGDTHGGQVRIGSFAPYPPRSRRIGGVVEGWVPGFEPPLYINRGYGWNVLPVRLGCPPAVVKFE